MCIGYFSHVRKDNGYWGALFLVAGDGDPADLLYTDVVTLNPITQRLLGPRVDAYVIDRLLLQPLVAELKTPVDVICFDEPMILQRNLTTAVPVAVFAPSGHPHRQGSWLFEAPTAGESGEGCWLQPDTANAARTALKTAVAAAAPFELQDGFRQLRAAMAELRK